MTDLRISYLQRLTGGRVSLSDLRIIFEAMMTPFDPAAELVTPMLPAKLQIGSQAWIERVGVNSSSNATFISHFSALKKLQFDFKQWIETASSNGVARARCLFVENWSSYTAEITDTILEFARAHLLKVKRDVATCASRDSAKSDKDYLDTIFPAIEKARLNILSGKEAVTSFTVFGTLLPPRRATDAATLQIFDRRDQDPSVVSNAFFREERVFRFQTFKTAGIMGTQIFSLDDEIFDNADAVRIAEAFFATFKIGDYVFPYSARKKDATLKDRITSYGVRTKLACGYSTNDTRHYWASKGRASSKSYQIGMANFMAHCVATQVGYAVNEASEGS